MTDGIIRSPRFLEGTDAATLTRVFWSEPKPRFHISKKGRSINFGFEVRIREEVLRKREYRELWSALFAPERHSGNSMKETFEQDLRRAYREARSGSKPVHRFISAFLRQVLRGAFRTWVNESWTLTGDEQRKRAELEMFERQSKIRRGPQPLASDAMKAFRLFGRYRPRVTLLIRHVRAKHDLKPLLTDSSIAAEIEKSGARISADAIRMALRTICRNSQVDLRLIPERGIAARSIAIEVAKQKMPKVDFHTVSFEKHMRDGKHLST